MNDHLNLMPLVARRRNLCWLRLRQWSGVWLLVIALSGAVGIVQASRVASEHYRLTALDDSTRPLREKQQELDQMLVRLKTLRSRESMLAMLERMEQPVQLLGIIGRSIGGDRPEVQVYDMVISPTQIVQVVKESEKAKDPKTNVATPATRNVDRVQLKIDGLGVDDLAVARFVAGLREAGVFETVALKSSIRLVSLPGESRQFSVECVFQ